MNANDMWSAERYTYEDELMAFVIRTRKTWTQDNRYGGSKCNFFYSDGSRCKGHNGHTGKHNA
jgi:hypothetical protein